MSEVTYLCIAVKMNEKEATEALNQVVGHLRWGGVEVLVAGVTSVE